MKLKALKTSPTTTFNLGIHEQCRCYKNQDLSTVHNSTRPSLVFHFQLKTINITVKLRGRNCT
ncbi:hypothetical protein CY35_01G044500 [Sphagnum magellanicum]|nr:hypothetical protein CY35_01G044500 [Sphagnum magellanicum]